MKQVKSVLNGKDINLTGDNTIITSNNFNVDKYGNMSCNGAVMNDVKINSGNLNLIGTETTPTIEITDYSNNSLEMYSSSFVMDYDYLNTRVTNYIQKGGYYVEGDSSSTTVWYNGIETPILTQTSLEESKKNFEKLQDNALDILRTIDIYKYNLKNEQDTDKKHIGFVIGDNYNYSKEVTSLDNKGVDNYSFTSLCCKAIQELSRKVEELENKLKEKEEN